MAPLPSTQESPPVRLDVKAHALTGGTLSGRNFLSNYERLMQETNGVGAERLLEWSARGELCVDDSGAQQVWLHLMVAVSLPLTCQRCLRPVDVAVNVNRPFRFVDDEGLAEMQDEAAQEDVLAVSKEFNLLTLIEDEVLMELPVVARHDACPVDVKLTAVDPEFDAVEADRRNPFSVLARLRNEKSD